MMNFILVEIQQWMGFSQDNLIYFANSDWLHLLWGLIVFLILRLLFIRFMNLSVRSALPESSKISLHRFRHPLIKCFVNDNLMRVESSRGWLWELGILQALRILMLLLAVIALSQPEYLKDAKTTENKDIVRDVMFVIESSVTFVLSDYELNSKPATRIQVVKQVLDDFIAGLKNSRIGLSVFANKAYTLLPLTSDMFAARSSLQRLKPNLAGRTDEGMGEALGLALQQTETASTTQTSNLKKVIVLISDGLSAPSSIPLSNIISYAQSLKVPIYTIGVGASNINSNKRKFDGLVYRPLNDEILRLLAAKTGGYYYHIGSNDGLTKVLQSINDISSVASSEYKITKRHIPLYHLPLGLALLFLLIYIILSPVLIRRIVNSRRVDS